MKYIITETDSWGYGPSLSFDEWTEEGQEDLEKGSWEEKEVLEIPETDTFCVYHLVWDIGSTNLIKLAEFSDYHQAKKFAKEEYFLTTGDYPFIKTHDGKGNRKEFTIPEDRNRTTKDYDGKQLIEYLIISGQEILRGHSLNPYATW